MKSVTASLLYSPHFPFNTLKTMHLYSIQLIINEYFAINYAHYSYQWKTVCIYEVYDDTLDFKKATNEP